MPTGFFPTTRRAEPPEPEPWTPPAWAQPPGDILPGRVVLDEVVATTDATLVLLREVRVYDEGLALRLTWMRRRRGESRRDWQNVGLEDLHRRDLDEPGALRVGVALADGTAVLPLGLREHERTEGGPVPPTLSVISRGGEGGPARFEGRLGAWLWSPAGIPRDFDIVVEWADAGIPETRLHVPADVVDRAPAPRPFWPEG